MIKSENSFKSHVTFPFLSNTIPLFGKGAINLFLVGAKLIVSSKGKIE
tara:strand:- start:491 stop:634 length:144 start_codon:yes stop_codon:yes gene_type:complete